MQCAPVYVHASDERSVGYGAGVRIRCVYGCVYGVYLRNKPFYTAFTPFLHCFTPFLHRFTHFTPFSLFYIFFLFYVSCFMFTFPVSCVSAVKRQCGKARPSAVKARLSAVKARLSAVTVLTAR